MSPVDVDPLAEETLSLLAQRAESSEIVLGGYFALQQYLSYRQTHDIDAWWLNRAAPATEAAIRDVMQRVAQRHGLSLRERAFGDTRSFELTSAGRKTFSFQIAVRDVALDEALPSRWEPIRIESLRDNAGSKMNALVNRGAARDFVDIHRIVAAGLASVADCWSWWQLKNPVDSVEAARQKVALHLGGIEARRPLPSLQDPEERATATATRTWFRDIFLAP